MVGDVHVPERVRDHRGAARGVDLLDGALGGRPAPRDKGLRPRDQVLLEERLHVVAGARGARDVRATHRQRVAGLRDSVLQPDRDAQRVQPLDDLLGPPHPLLLGALAGRGDCIEIDPISEHVKIIRVLMHAGQLHCRDALDAPLLRRRYRCPHAGDRIVVRERHGRHPRRRGGSGDLRRLELTVGHC
jgi:hypothetical protein